MSVGDLARTLTEIAATDPSRHGHTGPDTPEVAARYARRNMLVWRALAQALAAGLPAGVGWDPADSAHPVVVYLELPGFGQVSWHLPVHGYAWDGHTTAEKYARIDRFTGADRPPGDQPGLDCIGRGHITVNMLTPDGETYGWWCLWCGTAAYDPDRHVEEAG